MQELLDAKQITKENAMRAYPDQSFYCLSLAHDVSTCTIQQFVCE